MKVVTASFTPQYWGYPRDIAHIFGYKSPTLLLREFRQFCDKRPNYFKPAKPYIQEEGSDIRYNIFCFAHYFENKGMLDAGTRSLKFEQDLPRLIEAYSLHLLREEVI